MNGLNKRNSKNFKKLKTKTEQEKHKNMIKLIKQIYLKKAYNTKKFNICQILKKDQSKKVAKVKTDHQDLILQKVVININVIKNLKIMSIKKKENF